MSVFTESEPDDLVTTRPTLPRVNLLPPEISVERRVRQMRFGAGGVVVAALAVVALAYTSSLGSVHDAQDQLAASQARQARSQQQVNSYNRVDQTYKSAEARTQLRSQALQGKVLWSQYLNNLGLVTPTNVWLTAYTVAPATGGGAATTPTTPTSTSTAPKPFNPNTKTGGGASAPVTGSTATGSQTGIATVTFQGVGLSYNDVSAWLTAEAAQPNNIDAYTTSATEQLIGGRKVVVFSGTVSVTSGAYAPTTPGN